MCQIFVTLVFLESFSNEAMNSQFQRLRERILQNGTNFRFNSKYIDVIY